MLNIPAVSEPHLQISSSMLPDTFKKNEELENEESEL